MSTGIVGRTPPLSTARPVPTRAQFVVQADGICRALNSQEATLKSRLKGLEGESRYREEADAAPILRRIVTLARASNKRIEALAVPPAEAGTIARLETGWSEEATDLGNAAEAFSNHDSAAAREAAEKALTKVQTSDDALAQGLGMKACGSKP